MPNTKTSHVVSAVVASIIALGTHTLAHAQFNYTAQTRGVGARADSIAVVPYMPNTGMATTPQYPIHGNTDRHYIYTDASNFGPADLSTSAKSSYVEKALNLAAESTVSSHSELLPDKMVFQGSGVVRHNGDQDPDKVLSTGFEQGMGRIVAPNDSVSGGFSSIIDFNLDTQTNVVISWNLGVNGMPYIFRDSYNEYQEGTYNGDYQASISDTIGSQYLNIQPMSIPNSAQLSLAAGHHTLRVNTFYSLDGANLSQFGHPVVDNWSASVVVQAIPEGSSLAYMVIGLLGMTLLRRRSGIRPTQH